MPARKRKIKGKNKFNFRLVFYASLAVLSLLFAFLWLFGREKWNGRDILVTSYLNGNNVTVLIFNPQREEIYKIDIPENTQVSAVGNRGEWKLGSLWKLGFEQRLEGILLTQSIVKNFGIPVYTWGGSGFGNFYDGNFIKVLKTALFPGSTNLSLIERLNLTRFALSVREINKYEVALEDTGFIGREKLKDGSDGFVVAASFPKKLLPWVALFASGRPINISIVNVSGQEYDFGPLANAIETMGAKVVSAKDAQMDGYSNENDCTVEGDQREAEIFSKVFLCNTDEGGKKGGSDLVLVVGRNFIDRF